MQTFGLVIFSVLGMAVIGALSMAFYMLLPASMLERAAGHGRFSGLGRRDGLRNGPGKGRLAGLGVLPERSAQYSYRVGK